MCQDFGLQGRGKGAVDEIRRFLARTFLVVLEKNGFRSKRGSFIKSPRDLLVVSDLRISFFELCVEDNGNIASSQVVLKSRNFFARMAGWAGLGSEVWVAFLCYFCVRQTIHRRQDTIL